MMTIITDRKILEQVSQPVKKTDETAAIVADLVETAETGWTECCGLAAIQIGIPKRLAWYVLEGEHHVLFNPEITESKVFFVEKEGCLSIPFRRIMVKRAAFIKYINDGVECEASGYEAKIIQHLVDLMDGVLITEKEYVPPEKTVGRNEKCPCGSGLKFKKCCI